MSEMFNFCKECGTKNEKEYIYCKNCGAKLDVKEYTSDTAQDNSYSEGNAYEGQSGSAPKTDYAPYNPYQKASEIVLDEIDGIDVSDISAFVGKNSQKIVNKFSRIELSGSKTGWCWPAAIWGAILGPLGAGVWFCYRKMYKIGFSLLALGTALIIALSFAAGPDASATVYSDSIDSAVQSGDFGEIFSALSETGSMRNVIVDLIENAISLATAVLAGLYAMYAYKKFTVKKILEYRQRPIDQRYYLIGLAASGGTSVGMAILVLVASAVALELANMILLLF